MSFGLAMIILFLLRKYPFSQKVERVIFERILCITYVLMVLWLTIISRTNDNENIVYYDIIKLHGIIYGTIIDGFRASGLNGALHHYQWVKGVIEGHVLNTILFIPLGYLFPLTITKVNSWYKIALLGFLFSITIECVQYISHRGWFDANDILYNTLGALIGWMLFKNILNTNQRSNL